MSSESSALGQRETPVKGQQPQRRPVQLDAGARGQGGKAGLGELRPCPPPLHNSDFNLETAEMYYRA